MKLPTLLLLAIILGLICLSYANNGGNNGGTGGGGGGSGGSGNGGSGTGDTGTGTAKKVQKKITAKLGPVKIVRTIKRNPPKVAARQVVANQARARPRVIVVG